MAEMLTPRTTPRGEVDEWVLSNGKWSPKKLPSSDRGTAAPLSPPKTPDRLLGFCVLRCATRSSSMPCHPAPSHTYFMRPLHANACIYIYTDLHACTHMYTHVFHRQRDWLFALSLSAAGWRSSIHPFHAHRSLNADPCHLPICLPILATDVHKPAKWEVHHGKDQLAKDISNQKLGKTANDVVRCYYPVSLASHA